MSFLDRRTFLKTVGSIPLAVWLQRDALAQTTPLVRYDVLSQQGQAMLKIYEQGVAKMKALFESDPRSWTFQWYIHAVRGDRTKTTELTRIYPVPGPERTLAGLVWSTCQAHFNSANRPFFLPWHRLYVLRFERIIRKLTNQPTFTLPYWNYSASGSTHGILPAAFRVSTSSLFVQNRRSAVNVGPPIDASSSGALATTALNQCTYNPQGVLPGFCQALDSGLHGNVHILIGDGQNMGSVRWAARDPIFWLHHSNIDRLWASWNRAGRSNPSSTTFLNTTFTFADENGRQVVGKVGDVLSISRLSYAYSSYALVPSCPQTSSTSTALTDTQTTSTDLLQSTRESARVLAAAGPVPLASEPIRVQLKSSEARGAAPGTTFDKRIRGLRPTTHVYLVISKLQAAVEPEVLYEVYLVPSEEAGTKPRTKHRVGTINFFDAVRHGEDAQSLETDESFVSLDITHHVRRLLVEGHLKGEPSVTIIPEGQPATDAKPIIGSIELAFQ